MSFYEFDFEEKKERLDGRSDPEENFETEDETSDERRRGRKEENKEDKKKKEGSLIKITPPPSIKIRRLSQDHSS
jgi:hypothetical protein